MGVLTWIRRRETPLQRGLYAFLKGAERARFPVIPGVHHLFLLLRSFRRSVLRQLLSKIYHEPLLRLACANVGERLQLYEGGPKILGNLKPVIGDGVSLEGEHVWIAAGDASSKAFSIADDTYVGYSFNVVVGTEVRLGRHVLIANHVLLNGYDGHPLDPYARARHEPPGAAGQGAIIVGDYAWIGNRAVVLKGVTIGRGAVVASGAVVTKDVPELTVVAGNPAKPIRTIDAPAGWVRDLPPISSPDKSPDAS